MLFETQRLAVQRLKAIGSLSDQQRLTLGQMRAPKAFSRCVESPWDLLDLPGLRPTVTSVWKLSAPHYFSIEVAAPRDSSTKATKPRM
jgi:hypothetical protein